METNILGEIKKTGIINLLAVELGDKEKGFDVLPVRAKYFGNLVVLQRQLRSDLGREMKQDSRCLFSSHLT